MLSALIYILTEPLIVSPIIGINTSPPEINETYKERDEDRLTYEREDIIHETFYRNSCECKGMWYKNINWKYIDNVKDDVTELSKDELNVIVMGQLLVNINIKEVTTGWRCVPKEQNKPSSTCSNHGVNVQWNNENRMNVLYVLVDLPERLLFSHGITRYCWMLSETAI